MQGLLIFVPLAVLGAAVNWPASLGDPASVALPRLLDNEAAVRAGYVAYLVYSVLFAVTMVLLARLVENELAPGVRRLLIGFAVASALARCIGIVRWLGPMPELARDYSSAADDSQRYAVSTVFDAVNSYGGTIGEVLGVGLFAALSIFLLAVGLARSTRVPRWLTAFGFLAASSVALTAVELFGVDLGNALTLSVTVVQLWFIALGVWLLARGGRRFASA